MFNVMGTEFLTTIVRAFVHLYALWMPAFALVTLPARPFMAKHKFPWEEPVTAPIASLKDFGMALLVVGCFVAFAVLAYALAKLAMDVPAVSSFYEGIVNNIVTLCTK